MPISAEHAGRRYPPGQPMVVSADRIAAFADAIGDGDPIYRGAAAPAPPTFVMSVAAEAWREMFDDPVLDLALSRTVHADQRFRWARPIRAGDTIVPQLQIVQVRTRGTTETIKIEVRITTPEQPDDPLCIVESTLLHNRGVAK